MQGDPQELGGVAIVAGGTLEREQKCVCCFFCSVFGLSESCTIH